MAFWALVKEPARGSADKLAPTLDRATVRGLLRNGAFWTGTLGMTALVFSIGGLRSAHDAFFVRYGGYSLSGAAQWLGAITVVDGIAGTWIGGWLAQRWLRSNHRALYLISAWSAVLAIPGGLVAFFGPRATLAPAVLVAEFFLFLNTGPLNAAIVNSVGAQVRSTAIAVNLFLIHALGDAFSPRIIGKISDQHSLRAGPRSP